MVLSGASALSLSGCRRTSASMANGTLRIFFWPGALDFLQKPAVAFVRLRDSVVMESALESPIPVRFVFVLVGPVQSDLNYSEMGRAMGALMADWVRKRHIDATKRQAASGPGCEIQRLGPRSSVWRPSWPRRTRT